MKWLLNIFLTLIAGISIYVLGAPLLIGSILICIVQAIRKLKKEPLAEYFFELACVIDELGNVLAGTLFNLICFNPFMIKSVKHWFGSRKHTLSMILGVNWDNIHFVTKFVCWLFVELWDKGHFERAAKNYNNLYCEHLN